MSKVQLRIPIDIAQRLLTALNLTGPREPVVFGLVTHARAGDEIIFLRDIRIPPETAFLPSAGHGARWSGAYMISLLNEAISSNSGLFIFHPHGGRRVRMSGDDETSARALLPKFELVCPARPHGSVVVGPDSADGLITLPRQQHLVRGLSIRQFTTRILDYPLPGASMRERLRFRGSPLLCGAISDELLHAVRIVVVGQSGGGTNASLQLAQHGVGQIFGIDDDIVEHGNLFSGLGFSEDHVGRKALKVDVVSEQIRRLGSRTRYQAVRARVPSPEAISILKSADIIVGCVNNLHSRADLQEMALRYAIPYVDIGLILIPDGTREKSDFPPVRTISGNIFTYVPGGACMWCTEFLTDQKLSDETGGRGRPYLASLDGADARVVSFNGVLASQAVNEVLNLVLGFKHSDLKSAYWKFDGFSGSLTSWAIARNIHCDRCATYLSAGDPIWMEKRPRNASMEDASSVSLSVPGVQ
jgi:hypothetical protein